MAAEDPAELVDPALNATLNFSAARAPIYATDRIAVTMAAVVSVEPAGPARCVPFSDFVFSQTALLIAPESNAEMTDVVVNAVYA